MLPCIKEMPELIELVRDNKDKDVVFIGFSTSDKPKIDKFLQTKEFNYYIKESYYYMIVMTLISHFSYLNSLR